MRILGLGATAWVALAIGCSLPLPAQAGDFFSNLFGGFRASPPPPPVSIPFAREQGRNEARRWRVASSGGPAWCVRTCDGRYFPLAGNDNQSRASICESFCPSCKTEVVYGDDIDHAATASGKPYSQLPNAFRYRTEAVAGCTCNGKDQAGLASIPVENDPTLRKGDIVAGANGLVIANPDGSRHAEANFTPLPDKMRARFKNVPVVARE
jgi:hypothetical protein